MAAFIVRGGRSITSIFQNPGKRLAPVISSHSTTVHNGHSRTILSRRFPSFQTSCYSTLAETNEHDTLYKGVDIELKGHDPKVLQSYRVFLGAAATELDVDIYKVSTPPKKINRLSLLKSVHVHKKHYVQYETRTHYATMQIRNITGSTADTYLEYIQRNLPEGVLMKVTKCHLEKIPDHLRPPES